MLKCSIVDECTCVAKVGDAQKHQRKLPLFLFIYYVKFTVCFLLTDTVLTNYVLSVNDLHCEGKSQINGQTLFV